MVRRIGSVGVDAGMSCWPFCSAGLNQLPGGAPVKPESGKSGALKQPIRRLKTTQAPVTWPRLTQAPVTWTRLTQACMTSQLATSDGSSVA